MKKIVKSFLLTVLILFSLFVALNVYNKKSDDVFMLFGYTTFINTGTSMEPEIKAGDMFIIKSEDTYEIDDIISFKTKKGVNTHRIIEIHKDGYKTKGDSNSFVDTEIIDPDRVYGKYIYNVGNVTKVLKFFKKYQKILYFALPLTILFLLIIITRM